jgi:hypothetical protein
MVVPALQGTKKLAPLSAQRRKIVDRATARQQLLTAQAGPAREALKKASSAAIPARNPYSNLTDRQRKSAETRLAKAQATVAKLDKSMTKVGRARLFASGFAGSTKQGYDRFDNAARRGLIGRQRKPAASAANPTASVKPASKPAQAKAVRKLAFGQSDFEQRSQRTANIRNPAVKQNAQRLYGKILNLSSTPRQIKSMFKRAGKPKAAGRSSLDRQRQRDHKAMLAAAPMLFR